MKPWIAGLVMCPFLVACSDLPSEETPPPRPSAVAAGPVTISRNEGVFNYTGYTLDCSGGLVDMVGEQRYANTVVQHPSGDWMLNDHSRIEMRGTVLATGKKYVSHGQFNTKQVFAAPVSGAFTYTGSVHMMGITQGRDDNSSYRILAKWTVDATGKTSVEIFKVEWECRG